MKVDIVIGDYRYSFKKELGELDDIILQFTRVLNKFGIKYVVVSGYVAILFGRSRLSEDIDVIVEEFEFEKFVEIWKELNKDFWCIITDNPKNAYKDYLISGFALRFSLKNKIIPNVEIKFPKSDIERWVLENSIAVEINGEKLRISPIEMQIVFKLYLGSEKDIEDAKYLYSLFEASLNKNLFSDLVHRFNIENVARRYLRWNFQK